MPFISVSTLFAMGCPMQIVAGVSVSPVFIFRTMPPLPHRFLLPKDALSHPCPPLPHRRYLLPPPLSIPLTTSTGQFLCRPPAPPFLLPPNGQGSGVIPPEDNGATAKESEAAAAAMRWRWWLHSNSSPLCSLSILPLPTNSTASTASTATCTLTPAPCIQTAINNGNKNWGGG